MFCGDTKIVFFQLRIIFLSYKLSNRWFKKKNIDVTNSKFELVYLFELLCVHISIKNNKLMIIGLEL